MPDDSIEIVPPKKLDSHKDEILKSKKSSSTIRPGSARPPNYSEIWTEDAGKEVVPIADGKQVVPHEGIESDPHADEKHIVLPRDEKESFLREDHPRQEKRRLCGVRRKTFFIALGVLIICAAIVAIALAVNLTKKKTTQSPPEARNRPFLTSIDYDDPFDNPGSDTDPLTDLFYQRKDGVIRQATMLTNGTWLGAAADDFAATDAKPGTPIAVTSFTVRRTNQTAVTTRHLFYIDNHGTLKERLYDNVTRKWADGPLVELAIKPIPNPALQVCTGNDFVGNASTSFRDGLSLFYGSSNSTIQQVGWNYGDTKWIREQNFPDVNGHGGVSCNIRPEMSYVVTQNSAEIQFWWRDSNYTKHGNSTHPIGVWQPAPVSISGIFPNASLTMRSVGFGSRVVGTGGAVGVSGQRGGNRSRYIITQQSDLTIRAYNITGAAENLALAQIDVQGVNAPSIPLGNGVKALPGTKIAFTADPGPLGRQSTNRTWIAWFQTDPAYITQFTASSDRLDHWTESHVSITD